MAIRAITWKEAPDDFISTLSATATYRLHLAFARFPDDDTEVISTPGTGSSEVDSHGFSLTLQIGPYNLA
jgi:hypothetical protein